MVLNRAGFIKAARSPARGGGSCALLCVRVREREEMLVTNCYAYATPVPETHSFLPHPTGENIGLDQFR